MISYLASISMVDFCFAKPFHKNVLHKLDLVFSLVGGIKQNY